MEKLVSIKYNDPGNYGIDNALDLLSEVLTDVEYKEIPYITPEGYKIVSAKVIPDQQTENKDLEVLNTMYLVKINRLEKLNLSLIERAEGEEIKNYHQAGEINRLKEIIGKGSSKIDIADFYAHLNYVNELEDKDEEIDRFREALRKRSFLPISLGIGPNPKRTKATKCLVCDRVTKENYTEQHNQVDGKPCPCELPK